MFQSKDGNPVKTISKKGSLSGIGLHSGEKSSITFSPSDSGEINFIFKNKRIRACVENVTNTTRGTSLGDLQTIEHILAAADGLGINSLEIGLSAKELPNMDGSALPFVAALIACKPKALKQNKEPIIVKERIFLEDQNASIEILPYEGFCIDFETCFVGLGKQNFTFNESTNFITEIAPARTFGYKEEVEELKKHGLAKGASLENSLVLNKKKGYVNVARFEEEPVRHKILDLIG
ncbi:hypothetical protein A3J90_01715, partial [candidate division WOR-1 bacterium RIFOXYC2_FULL_37_10]